MNFTRLNSVGPAQLAEGEGEPGVCVELDNVWRSASAMGQTLDALNRAEWRNPNLNGIARTQEGEFFEQVANRGRFLCFVARAKKRDGLEAVLGFYSSAGHTPILHA